MTIVSDHHFVSDGVAAVVVGGEYACVCGERGTHGHIERHVAEFEYADLESQHDQFAVWVDGEPEESARVFLEACAADAAISRARLDYKNRGDCDRGFPVAYRARNKLTGELFMVEVDFVMRPHFTTVVDAIPMPPAVHVLWGDRAVCEDPRLRGEPGGWSWPEGQTWITLHALAQGDGEAVPAGDRCHTCWKKAPGLVEGLRQIGAK